MLKYCLKLSLWYLYIHRGKLLRAVVLQNDKNIFSAADRSFWNMGQIGLKGRQEPDIHFICCAMATRWKFQQKHPFTWKWRTWKKQLIHSLASNKESNVWRVPKRAHFRSNGMGKHSRKNVHSSENVRQLCSKFLINKRHRDVFSKRTQ